MIGLDTNVVVRYRPNTATRTTGSRRSGSAIKPKKRLREEDISPATFKKLLILESEWVGIPPSIFPHDIHNYWLDCASCHREVFNIKKKTTKHFLMKYLLEGKFCGVCHLKIAFPLDDCKRCHPDIKR